MIFPTTRESRDEGMLGGLIDMGFKTFGVCKWRNLLVGSMYARPYL